MKLWDPHFHIWDVSSGVDDAGYALARYERDVDSEGFELIGGTFVEVMSAQHAGVEGQAFADACSSEADWVSRQLGAGRLPYNMVASAPLEHDGVSALLQQLAADDRVRGVRQILNYEPSWPRNGHLGNLLERTAWQQGFRLLAEHALRFDLQLNPHQFAAAARLVAAHPRIPVVIDHLGTPTRADLRGETYWDGMRAFADCAHTTIKLSMLPYIDPEWIRTHWSRRASCASSICSAWSAASSPRTFPSISGPSGPRRACSARSHVWSARCRRRTGSGCSPTTPSVPTGLLTARRRLARL